MTGARPAHPKRSHAAPQVSVVMPVHDALPYLDSAIESILGQSFADFEFVILDDGSTDGSTERLREWAASDPRIRLIEEKENLGPAGSSERVARAASAPVVARMDADDISHPDRLAAQLDVLREHPRVGVVGSLCDIIDEQGRRIRAPELWRLCRRSWSVPFAHGTIMYRKRLFDRIGGYREECELWEDQDLVARMAAVSDVMVVPRSLYQVRQTPTSIRFTSELRRQEQALDRMYRSLGGIRRDGADGDPGDKVDPRVFISLGSVILWSGGRPRLFRRLLRRARLGADFRSLGAIAWTSWASVSPRTLRAFLRLRLWLRNALARPAIDSARPAIWSPPGKAVAAHRGRS